MLLVIVYIVAAHALIAGVIVLIVFNLRVATLLIVRNSPFRGWVAFLFR